MQRGVLCSAVQTGSGRAAGAAQQHSSSHAGRVLRPAAAGRRGHARGERPGSLSAAKPRPDHDLAGAWCVRAPGSGLWHPALIAGNAPRPCRCVDGCAGIVELLPAPAASLTCRVRQSASHRAPQLPASCRRRLRNSLKCRATTPDVASR